MNKEEKIKQANSYAVGVEMESVTYNLAIGGFLLYGLFITYLLSTQIVGFMNLIGNNPYILLIGYFVLAIGGSVLLAKAKSVLVRFLAYNLIVLPLGLLVGLSAMFYTNETVVQALGATASVVVLMTALAIIRPQFFQKLGGILGISLFAAIISQAIMMIFTGTIPVFVDWVIVVVFAGFIGYDWSIAQIYPKTTGNAVFAAASIYLDIINIFLRLLKIFGNRD